MKSTFFQSFIFIAFVCSSVGAFAQNSWAWVAGNTVDTVADADTYNEYEQQFTGSTGSTMDFGVVVLENTVPANWDGMVCIYGKCLGIIPPVGDTATMLPLLSGDVGYVRLTINPFSNKDSALLRILVYDLNNPTDADTATWIVNQKTLSVESFIDQSLEIFPNPATEYVTLSGLKAERVTVVNVQGQEVYVSQTEQLDGLEINVQNWPKGVYIIQCEKSGNRWESARFIVK